MNLQRGQISQPKLKEILCNISQHAPKPNKVRIIAVTKTFDISTIQSAIKNKIFLIGENKVQETKQKLLKYTKPQELSIHMIGHLQKNKAKQAVELYDVIESVDTIKIAKAINQAAEKKQKQQKIFIQIKISNNTNHKGVAPEKAKKLILEILKLKNINTRGIMAIGPKTKNIQRINRAYKKISKLQKKLQKETRTNLKELSLGMSSDYIYALKQGATLIRIGTALFGKRQ